MGKKHAPTAGSIKVGYAGQEWIIPPLGPGDTDIIHGRTPYKGMDDIPAETFPLALVYLARYKNGETSLTWAELIKHFPTYESIVDAGITAEVIEAEDDPEV